MQQKMPLKLSMLMLVSVRVAYQEVMAFDSNVCSTFFFTESDYNGKAKAVFPHFF